MDCNHETYKICVTHNGSVSTNLTDQHFLSIPLKDVIKAKLVATSIPWNDTANVVYVTVDEFDSKFTDFAAPMGTASLGNGLTNQTPSSLKRRAMGPLYSLFRGSTGDNRILYRNEYPIEVDFIYPIKKLERLSVSVRDESDTIITIPSGLNAYFYFEIVCKRANLCY